jgi:hypothetical protein
MMKLGSSREGSALPLPRAGEGGVGVSPRVVTWREPPPAALFERSDLPCKRLQAGEVQARNPSAALFHRHGDMQIPLWKALAEAPAFGHIYVRSSIPGGRCSQGGVKIPTGGKGDVAQARERLLLREFLSEIPEKKGQQIRCDSEADG